MIDLILLYVWLVVIMTLFGLVGLLIMLLYALICCSALRLMLVMLCYVLMVVLLVGCCANFGIGLFASYNLFFSFG